MSYGINASPVTGLAGAAMLPSTGNNTVLFMIATSLIVLGAVVFIVSLVLARKNRHADTN